MKPTQAAERFEVLDALRGLALLGIVSANMILFSLYLYLPEAKKAAMATHASDRLRRVAIGGLAPGLPLNAAYAASFDSGSWPEMFTGTFGVLPLSAGYVAVFCLMWLRPGARERLRVFTPVGRMALTNYVGQSVICTLVFYGTGLGLGGTMGPTLYLPIGLAVYAVQVPASQLWLGRFRFGPLEWLWRMLTYGEWLPLAKRAAA